MIASPLQILDPSYERVLGRIEAAESITELQSAVEKLLKPYGLSHVVYHALRIPQASINQTAVVFTYPTDWISHYAGRRYYVIDPVVLQGVRSVLPYDWSGLKRSGKPVLKMFNEAAEAGIGRHGITIPIRGAAGEHALFTVTSDASDHDWGHLKLIYMRDMQLVAFYVHSRIMEILKVPQQDYLNRLSRREQECLQWAASGKTIEDTATILSLSHAAVRGYLDSARHKLDCLTKTQAVARALRFGLISY